MSAPFSPEVATRLIHEKPGRTAAEIVEEALSNHTIEGTMIGQQGALVKMLMNGRLPHVVRDETRRPYRYYPRNPRGDLLETTTTTSDGLQFCSTPQPQAVTFRPTPEQDRIVTALILVNKASTRVEAIQWLLDQAISAKSDTLQRVLAGATRIQEILRAMEAAELACDIPGPPIQEPPEAAELKPSLQATHRGRWQELDTPEDILRYQKEIYLDAQETPDPRHGSDQPDFVDPRSHQVIRCRFTPHCREHGLLLFRHPDRFLFPGYKVPFILEADGKALSAWVTSAPRHSRPGDPAAGRYIVGGLQEWYRLRPELREGDSLTVEVLEPMRRYRLTGPAN